MIEDMEAVERIDEIAAVEGVDLLAVGPSDLSRSLRVSGQPDHPRLVAAIDRVSARMLADGMADPARPVYPSTLRIAAADFARRHPGIGRDRDGARILRSVLMKPEAETYVRELHSRVEQLAGD